MVAFADNPAARIRSELARCYADAIRPVERLSPLDASIRWRRMHEVYCSERPGAFDPTWFPWQGAAANVFQEAMETGKRGIATMKDGQGGGTDWNINGLLWLKTYYPGPMLFMTTTEEQAAKFGRERFRNVIPDWEPLNARYRPNPRGDTDNFAFSDGELSLTGGNSIFNFQSNPQRFVGIDEADSLAENLRGEGDPFKLARIRMASFTGHTLMVAWAHPTTEDRGIAKIFLNDSDQRYAHVHHDCGHEFYFAWEHVKPLGNERDPGAYQYVCPGCGAVVEDAQRVAMMRRMVYRSILPAEVAAKKTWIGIQTSKFHNPAKTIRSFAEDWIETDCGRDENAARVFFNKTLGRPYKISIKEASADDWRRQIVVPHSAKKVDPHAYYRGQIPPGVQFLTAGQDSRGEQLHYAVWGWGLTRISAESVTLRRWAIDWGAIERPKSLVLDVSDLRVFNQLIYQRTYPTTYNADVFDVRECGHDTGWNPVAVYEYCADHLGRAMPIKGASDSSLSTSLPWRLGNRPRYKLNGEEIELNQELILFNTYQLKLDWHNSYDKRVPQADGGEKVPILTLPVDVDDEFVRQLASEYLTHGRRKGEKVFAKRGENHFGDCSIYAYGLAKKIQPALANKTAEEVSAERDAEESRQSRQPRQQTQKTWIADRDSYISER